MSKGLPSFATSIQFHPLLRLLSNAYLFNCSCTANVRCTACMYRLYMEGIVTIGCYMDFSMYPYDAHRCKYIMGSTVYPDSLMAFNSTYSFWPEFQRPLQYEVKWCLNWNGWHFIGFIISYYLDSHRRLDIKRKVNHLCLVTTQWQVFGSDWKEKS